ncbi:PREDICTED: allatostatin-A receptor-like [Priapulus caudatus]|uniref:Allatostatin-A receptor-like n=1 Tax=Priapulus caudatus TaxID=37621 RepID=A0ABM1EK95_PRICU|nr:PREDICTED: allatostatin-A receptor-like [Priapulus caudatus]
MDDIAAMEYLDYLNMSAANRSTALLPSDNWAPLHTIVGPVACAAIAVLGIVGNVLVILSVLLSPYMRGKHENWLVVNLAVINLLFVSVCVPLFGAHWSLESWPFGREMCRFFNYTVLLSYLLAIYTLLLMAVERYLVALDPTKSRRRFCLASMAAIWIVFGTLTTLYALRHTTVYSRALTPGGQRKTYCLPRGLSLRIFFGFMFGIGYVVPLIVIAALYVAILFLISRSGRSVTCYGQMKRATLPLAALVIAFGVAWLPYYVISLESLYGELWIRSSVHADWIHLLATVSAYLHACVNPLIYALFSPVFRRRFWQLTRCRREDDVIYGTMKSEEQGDMGDDDDQEESLSKVSSATENVALSEQVTTSI